MAGVGGFAKEKILKNTWVASQEAICLTSLA